MEAMATAVEDKEEVVTAVVEMEEVATVVEEMEVVTAMAMVETKATVVAKCLTPSKSLQGTTHPRHPRQRSLLAAARERRDTL